VLVGLLFLWRALRVKATLLFVYVGIFYAINVFFSQPFARYMLPLVPVLALIAALGWESLEGGIWSRSWIKKILLACVLIEMFIPVSYGNYLFTQKDTRTECLEWIHKNVREGSTIVVDNRFYAPQLSSTKRQILRKYDLLGEGPKREAKAKRLDLELEVVKEKKAYEVYTLVPEERLEKKPIFLFSGPFVKADMKALRKIGADYVVVNTSERDMRLLDFYEELSQRLEPTVSFSPYKDSSQRMPLDSLSSTAAPHRRDDLLSRNRLGPHLEVYKIR